MTDVSLSGRGAVTQNASALRKMQFWSRVRDDGSRPEGGRRCAMRLLRVAVVGVALLAAGRLSGGELRQQPVQQPGQGAGFPGVGRAPGDEIPISPEVAQRQAQTRNSDRQKHLVADTDKLLALATELKQDVDKTNKDVLSVEVIKKAEEIEKLAHSVKERMKG
jgi:hypothetical protein